MRKSIWKDTEEASAFHRGTEIPTIDKLQTSNKSGRSQAAVESGCGAGSCRRPHCPRCFAVGYWPRHFIQEQRRRRGHSAAAVSARARYDPKAFERHEPLCRAVRAPRFHQMFFVTPCSYRRRGDHAEAFKFFQLVLSAVVRCKTYRAPVARLAAAAAAAAPAGFVSCIAPSFFYTSQFPLYSSLMRNRLKLAETHSRAFLFSQDNSRAVTSVTTGCLEAGVLYAGNMSSKAGNQHPNIGVGHVIEGPAARQLRWHEPQPANSLHLT
jgi:hypothetical protein